ncbi:hypothetical protein EGW08_022892 [Elysia chlorotica]|uniref:DNA-directed RNA polymerase subunit n=1 Tax=Elysia chlorotica TaxID=188477 RepID=A0A433SK45_ELYCH|nr:hypothetical protein EGW08_022892 [Elysia chlorotica]
MPLGTKPPAFSTDLQFCPMCGSVLPAPALGSDRIPCSRCPFYRTAQEYHDVVEEFEIQYNTPKSKKEKKRRKELADEAMRNIKSEDKEEFLGPTVERQCPRCSNDTMYYTTRQTRSADEGQTVFYTCVKCKFQDIEYS